MLIEKILIISLFTIGYCCTFWEGMIFEKLGDKVEHYTGEWLWKPLGGCYICACMWIGSLLYWLKWHGNIFEWFICCVGAMGVNAVISQLTKEK